MINLDGHNILTDSDIILTTDEYLENRWFGSPHWKPVPKIWIGRRAYQLKGTLIRRPR